jgi:hypothetical protein
MDGAQSASVTRHIHVAQNQKGFPPTDDHIKQILIVVDGRKIAERHKGKWESLNPNYSVTDDLHGDIIIAGKSADVIVPLAFGKPKA